VLAPLMAKPLDEIVEHNAGDLTAVLQAGVPLARAPRPVSTTPVAAVGGSSATRLWFGALSRALDGVKAEWKTEPQPSGKELFKYLKDNPEGSGRPTTRGAVEDAEVAI